MKLVEAKEDGPAVAMLALVVAAAGQVRDGARHVTVTGDPDLHPPVVRTCELLVLVLARALVLVPVEVLVRARVSATAARTAEVSEQERAAQDGRGTTGQSSLPTPIKAITPERVAAYASVSLPRRSSSRLRRELRPARQPAMASQRGSPERVAIP